MTGEVSGHRGVIREPVDTDGVHASEARAFPETEPIPTWLEQDPTGPRPTLVRTAPQILPFDELTSEDFERLVLRYLRRDPTVEQCRLYGTSGQKQYGIDLYARLRVPGPGGRRYLTIQCRNVATIGPSAIVAAAEDFLTGHWAQQSAVFVLATRASTRSTQQVEAIEAASRRLEAAGCRLEVWDGEELSERLRNLPELVDAFFAHGTALAFCAIAPDADAQRHGAGGTLLAPEALQPVRPIHNLPRRPTSPFVGRDAEMQALTATVSASDGVAVQVVHGLGGVGKSELVLQYSHVQRDRYLVRWWITAQSGDEIDAGLVALARRLNPGTSTAQDIDLVDWAIGWLQTHTGWLLVLDNVEARSAVESLIGQLDSGHIMITSRRDIGWETLSEHCLRLATLPADASVHLLVHRSGQDHRPLSASLADELGHLPLALHQASAYLAQTKTPVEAYLARLRAQPAKVLAVTAHGDAAERAVARVLTITLDTIGRHEPAAAVVLGILSFYAPDNIPRAWFTDLLLPSDVDHVLALLASYNAVGLTTQKISIHRLVQVFAAEQLRHVQDDTTEPSAEEITRGLALSLLWQAMPRDHPQHSSADWPAWTQLSPHVEAFAVRYPTGEADLTLGRLLGEVGLFHHTHGRYQHALRLQRDALALTEAVLGPNDAEVAVQLDNIAGTMCSLGEVDAAEPLQRRALEICQSDLEPDHPEIAIRMDNLGATLRTLGSFDEAEQLHRQALSIAEAEYGEADPEVVIVLNNLALTLQQAGRAADAQPLLRRALVINEATMGPESEAVANNLDNLGLALTALDRPGEAVPLQRRAVNITEAALGPDHPAAATRLNNLASSLIALGQCGEAAALQQRALALFETALGEDNPRLVVSLANLAITLQDHLDQADDAIPLLQRALEITNRVGVPRTDPIELMIRLAVCLMITGQPEQAEPIARQAVDLCRATSADDEDLIKALTAVGGVLQNNGNPREAVAVLSQAEDIAVATFGSNHRSTIVVQDGLATNWKLLERYDEAAAARRRALTGAEALPDASHDETLWRMHDLADLLLDDKPEEAAELCRRALAIAEQTGGPASRTTALALNNLARPIGELHGHEAAEPLLRRAVAIGRSAFGPHDPEYLILVANLRDCLAASGQLGLLHR
ncbi:FxSxx-COOH system tetratricopeptide repeat protein [Pilimelia columellifera]|uniref:Tetratricopeptide repeat protein n=1 Tax=Pilimelia columellifera subsp. columellifera TaxID=706583 RepID=A0ABP6B4H2_9ACTN